jgi:hypothetical protein
VFADLVNDRRVILDDDGVEALTTDFEVSRS